MMRLKLHIKESLKWPDIDGGTKRKLKLKYDKLNPAYPKRKISSF